ncbi:MAG: hypothetical protein HOL28_00940 [Crocinitomicaceae bacterium]|nr:hypothetical protein [Crocinitomicaceae bacterium]
MRLVKIYLFVALAILLISFNLVDAQSFKILGNGVQNITIDRNGKLELAEIKFLNTTQTDLYLNWERVENTLPIEWDYSMCAFGKCQIGIPTGGALKLISPGKPGFMAIHVFPKGIKGKGTVQFKLFDSRDESKFEVLEFHILAE